MIDGDQPTQIAGLEPRFTTKGGSSNNAKSGFTAKGSVMFESKSPKSTAPDPTVRTLKIEADGDFWKGVTMPKIRLMGRWLERAGFSPGNRVQVTCLAPGVIELRSPEASTVNAKQPSPEPPDRPF